ncbi:MAG: ATP-binding protein, partial [Pseudomonadales bacterium]|nr:ATP-binding protein [Pseudomonadales bacterium]
IAFLLLELGIYQVLESVLGVFAIAAVAWLTTLATDLGINKPLGLSPRHIEFKRAYLYDVNPVGIGAMLLSSVAGVLCYLDMFGTNAQALTHFITILIAAGSTVAIAWLTGGRYYIARRSDEYIEVAETHTCVVCSIEYERDDMAFCPAYTGAICSLCCSLDARCMDQCKTNATLGQQVYGSLQRFLPDFLVEAFFTRVSRFSVRFIVAAAAMAAFFSLTYYVFVARGLPEPEVASALWTVYFLFVIVVGVITWLFLLTSESREVAHQESDRQTERLLKEIEAHEKTDQELQAAKETAEAASFAKTRYLSGISHEFRTPLQSILGYAQILKREERDESTRRAVEVIHRSGEHLSDLVEGLLDVSRIEAGRIELRSETVRLPDLVHQLIAIFKPLATNKGVDLQVNLPNNLPTYVRTDPQRLRQILTNLLSNAVKFTRSGAVTFSVNYSGQVAEFRIRDTGTGIRSADLETIFIPFERVRPEESLATSGTGLGLTIVKLLCDVMGGDVSVHSELGVGSEFMVSLYLPPTDAPVGEKAAVRDPTGYAGMRRRILVVDDDPVQRGLLSEVLLPLGFLMHEARDAQSCLDIIESTNVPDLILADVTMPGMSGIELSRVLREKYPSVSIIMVSANADEPNPGTDDAYDHYLVKPIRFEVLLDQLEEQLALNWTFDPIGRVSALSGEIRDVLIHHAELGHASGFRQALQQALVDEAISKPLAEQLFADLDGVQFAVIVKRLSSSPS